MPGGGPGAGDAGLSVYRVRESISGEDDKKEAGMGRSGERASQAERTACAKARGRNGPDLLEGKKEGVAVWGRENKVDMIWDETRKVDRGQIMEGLLC